MTSVRTTSFKITPFKQTLKNAKQRKAPPRMASAELEALFNRLDVDRNGGLSQQEFKAIVTKLNLKRYHPDVEEFVKEIFACADDDGLMDKNEFEIAYNTLYNKLTERPIVANNFVRATRYGLYE